MDRVILDKMIAWAESEEETGKTVSYLQAFLRSYLKTGENVLICFDNWRRGSLGWMLEQAVRGCGAVPVIWGPDYRWKTILQLAFYSRAAVIIAPPLIALGLTKLMRHSGLPLYVRHAVCAGYPCLDWMAEGIMRGLDCSSSGIFSLGDSGIVGGVSCEETIGVHIREDVFGVDIVSRDGTVLPAGELGEMVIYPRHMPQLRLAIGENARILAEDCPCGVASHRLVDMQPGREVDGDLVSLGQQLQSWMSVLDCRLQRGLFGLEMELVVFPGEKLPKLPSSAKQVIRPWNPGEDTPFSYMPAVKKPYFSAESH